MQKMILRNTLFGSLLFCLVAVLGHWVFEKLYPESYSSSSHVDIVNTSRFGNIEVHTSSWNKTGPLMIFFFDDINLVDHDLVQGFVDRGTIVALVSFDAFQNNVLQDEDSEMTACYEYAGEIARLSQVLQNRFEMKMIGKALLIGQGSRSSQFVYAVEHFLGEDLLATVSIGLKELNLPLSFCQLDEEDSTPTSNWRYLADPEAEFAENFKTHFRNDTFLSCNSNSCPILDEFFAKQKSNLKTSAIFEQLPKKIDKDYFVILLSGDGGWASIDKYLSKSFLKNGIPVIGFDSLLYFWRKKTVEQITNDLQNTIAQYQDRLHLSKVVLVGFSFGANVIPFVLSRLPEEIRRNVIYTALLNPTTKTEFEIHFSDWLPGDDYQNGIKILPEFSKISQQAMSCIVGEDEESSLCGQALPSWVKIITLSGSHHYDGNYKAVSSAIKRELALHGN